MAEKDKPAEESSEVEVKKEAGGKAVATAEPESSTQAQRWDLESEFDRLFENFFRRNWLTPARMEFPTFPSLRDSLTSKLPKVNVIERDDEFVVEAELPGIDKDDVEVSITPSAVTIAASTRKESEEEKGNYHRREIHTGHFSRTLPLPSGVETDKTKAKFKDGMLRLKMPKAEEARTRSIKVE